MSFAAVAERLRTLQNPYPGLRHFDVAESHPLSNDVARLSPFVRHHINLLGRYSFRLPDLSGGMRPLRDPDAADE